MTSRISKVLIVTVLLAAIVGVLVMKSRQSGSPTLSATQENVSPLRQVTSDTSTLPTQNMTPPEHKPAPRNVRAGKTPPAPVTRPTKPKKTTAPAVSSPKTPPVVSAPEVKPAPAIARTLPRVLELGADKCVPCKMMQPVLAELRQEYAGKLQVDFIDVWQNPSAGAPYGIRAIPTQIFFDADGNEIYRHLGFYPKEDILAVFNAHGIVL